MTPKGTGEVPAAAAKADTAKIAKETADQLKIAQRIVQKYYAALRDITE